MTRASYNRVQRRVDRYSRPRASPAHNSGEPLRPVLVLSEAAGQACPREFLIQQVAQYSWKHTFVKLSRIASIIARHDNGPFASATRDWTTDMLLRHTPTNELEHRVVTYLHSQNLTARPLAHELSVYVLQALTLLHGSDAGPEIQDGTVAFLLLAANDHCFTWLTDDEPEAQLDSLFTDVVRNSHFNHYARPLNDFVRMPLLLSPRPMTRNEWPTDAAWAACMTEALGCPLEIYISKFAGPVYMMSRLWGTSDPLEYPAPSTVSIKGWLQALSDLRVRDYLIEISGTREEYREHIRCREDVPLSISSFYRKPFVRIDDDLLCSFSPWCVQEQLRGGLWGRLRTHMQLKHPEDPELWHRVFGILFEQWCQKVAQLAAKMKRFPDKVITPSYAGAADEIEDVVLKSGKRVALFSCKASAVPEYAIKNVESRTRTLGWYERLLFAPSRPGRSERRGGAVRQLHDRIRDIRNGAYAARGIGPDVEIYPVIVSYERLGIDTAPGYVWLNERLATENLLRDAGPLAAIHVEDYESLLSLGSHGISPVEVLANRSRPGWREKAVHDLVRGKYGPRVGHDLFIPELVKEFERIADQMQSHLPDTVN